MATGFNLFQQATAASSDSSHNRLQVDANGVLQLVNSAGVAYPVGSFYLFTELVDISAAGSGFIAVPAVGVVTTLQTCIAKAITSGDAVMTAEIDDTAITGISITVANSGSAPGDVDTGTATALNVLAVGNALEMKTNNGSSTVVVVTGVFTVERRAS